MENTLQEYFPYGKFRGLFMPFVGMPADVNNHCVISNSGELYLKNKIKVKNNMYLNLC